MPILLLSAMSATETLESSAEPAETPEIDVTMIETRDAWKVVPLKVVAETDPESPDTV